MIDYYSQFASLDMLSSLLDKGLQNGQITENELHEARDMLRDNYSYAVIGTLIDRILEHDGLEDEELSLLREAADIWKDMQVFVEDFRNVRDKFEEIALNPYSSANALTIFNQAKLELVNLITRWEEISNQIRAYFPKFQTLTHVFPHLIADDLPVSQWEWRDVILSRRTGAFVYNIMKLAKQDGRNESIAFALGALSGHVANALGSNYLVHVVGGPRRSHLIRDRLASYTVGTWIRESVLDPPFDRKRTQSLPLFVSPEFPRLPQLVIDILEKSLSETYLDEGPSTPPDFNRGYQLLVEHLQLLNAFSMSPISRPLNNDLYIRIAGNVSPQDLWRPDNPGPQPGPSPNTPVYAPCNNPLCPDPGPGCPPWVALQEPDDLLDWITTILVNLLLFVFFIPRLVVWATRGITGNDIPTPSTGAAAQYLSTPSTSGEYDKLVQSKEMLLIVDGFAHMDEHLSEQSRLFIYVLKLLGLLYPDLEDLPDPRFAQFLRIPPQSFEFNWPGAPLKQPQYYLSKPDYLTEEPVTKPSHFPAGSRPTEFLFSRQAAGTRPPTVAERGLALWKAEILDEATSPIRSTNLNLDGDRGADFICWAVKAGTSIKDNPVNLDLLGYNDI